MDQMRQHIENKDKAWLVSTLHSAGDAIMTCDSADRLDFANTEALKILGYKLPEILGKPFAGGVKNISGRSGSGGAPMGSYQSG